MARKVSLKADEAVSREPPETTAYNVGVHPTYIIDGGLTGTETIAWPGTQTGLAFTSKE